MSFIILLYLLLVFIGCSSTASISIVEKNNKGTIRFSCKSKCDGDFDACASAAKTYVEQFICQNKDEMCRNQCLAKQHQVRTWHYN